MPSFSSSNRGSGHTSTGEHNIAETHKIAETTTNNKNIQNESTNKSLPSASEYVKNNVSFYNINNNNECDDGGVNVGNPVSHDAEDNDNDAGISSVFPPMFLITKTINLLPASTIENLARLAGCCDHLLPDPDQMYGGQAHIPRIRCKLYSHYGVDGGSSTPLVDDLISIGYYPQSCHTEEEEGGCDTEEEEDIDDVDPAPQVSKHYTSSNATNINPNVQDPLPSDSGDKINHVSMPTPKNAKSLEQSISPTNVIDFPGDNNHGNSINNDNDQDIDVADYINGDTFGTSQSQKQSTEELDDDCGRGNCGDIDTLHRPSPKRHKRQKCGYIVLFCLNFLLLQYHTHYYLIYYA